MVLHEEKENRWSTVRIPTELLQALDDLVKEEKDDFGSPKYRNKSAAAAEAVRQFLKKHSKKGA